MKRLIAIAIALWALTAIPIGAAAEQDLDIQVYNPGAAAIFPTSSEIIVGQKEVLLIDAQFTRRDADALVEKIRATGKPLTTIYISHSDPDYYFGLQYIHKAFPKARILATPQTVAAIEATKDGKLTYWGPVLKSDAPTRLIVPEALIGDTLDVDGNSLKVVGLTGPTPNRTFVWIPSKRAVVGGVLLTINKHVWTADTPTTASRHAWLAALDSIEALRPELVVPGHFLPNPDGTRPFTVNAISFTRDYLTTFDREASVSPDSSALIAAMKNHYPQLAGVAGLELSAKVAKGEMEWPSSMPTKRNPPPGRS